jgi:hypothetical protein
MTVSNELERKKTWKEVAEAQFEVLPRSGQERIEKTTKPLCHLVGVRSKFQPDTQSDTDLIGVFCERTAKVKAKGRVVFVKAMKVYGTLSYSSTYSNPRYYLEVMAHNVEVQLSLYRRCTSFHFTSLHLVEPVLSEV